MGHLRLSGEISSRISTLGPSRYDVLTLQKGERDQYCIKLEEKHKSIWLRCQRSHKFDDVTCRWPLCAPPLSLSPFPCDHFEGERVPLDRSPDQGSFPAPRGKPWIVSRNFTPWILDVKKWGRVSLPSLGSVAARGMLRRPLCRRIHFLAWSWIGGMDWRETGGKENQLRHLTEFFSLDRIVDNFRASLPKE